MVILKEKRKLRIMKIKDFIQFVIIYLVLAAGDKFIFHQAVAVEQNMIFAAFMTLATAIRETHNHYATKISNR